MDTKIKKEASENLETQMPKQNKLLSSTVHTCTRSEFSRVWLDSMFRLFNRLRNWVKKKLPDS